VAQVAEHLSSKCAVLSSNLSTGKKRRNMSKDTLILENNHQLFVPLISCLLSLFLIQCTCPWCLTQSFSWSPHRPWSLTFIFPFSSHFVINWNQQIIFLECNMFFKNIIKKSWRRAAALLLSYATFHCVCLLNCKMWMSLSTSQGHCVINWLFDKEVHL
jgi:hypothetical protein